MKTVELVGQIVFAQFQGSLARSVMQETDIFHVRIREGQWMEGPVYTHTIGRCKDLCC